MSFDQSRIAHTHQQKTIFALADPALSASTGGQYCNPNTTKPKHEEIVDGLSQLNHGPIDRGQAITNIFSVEQA
jgi:hypothetical protein